MMKTLTLEQVDELVDTNDRYFWETYALRLVCFTPIKIREGDTFWPVSKNSYRNPRWRRGKGQWGRAKIVEVGSDGLYRL